jgi:RimJ/RimL family protein N-acetyltransferase
MAAFPLSGLDALMAHWKERILGNDRVQSRTICVGDEVAGNAVCFKELSQDGERGCWLIGLGSEFWGRGIATLVMAAFIQELPRRPLFAFVAEHNMGSRRVLDKVWLRISGGIPRQRAGRYRRQSALCSALSNAARHSDLA